MGHLAGTLGLLTVVPLIYVYVLTCFGTKPHKNKVLTKGNEA